MQVRVLGCSGGIGKDLRTTSFLVNDHLLLDAGTGVGELTIDEMLAIRHVLLTHAHLDHVTGLALMLASIYDNGSLPINVYSPPAILSVLRSSLFNWQLWANFAELPNKDEPLLQEHALDVEEIKTITPNISVKPVLLSHSVDSYAYIIREGQCTTCFCGDTGPTEKLWQEINDIGGVDHIIIEASYPNESELLARQSGHYTPALLAKDLNKLHKTPIVHIHHIKPGNEEIIAKQCKEALIDFQLNMVFREQVLDIT